MRQRSGSGHGEQLLRATDGTRLVIVVERAQRMRLDLFSWNGPTRVLNSVVNNQDWWVTVEPEAVRWPVVKEAYPSEASARARGALLRAEIETGAFGRTKPAFRRRHTT